MGVCTARVRLFFHYCNNHRREVNILKSPVKYKAYFNMLYMPDITLKPCPGQHKQKWFALQQHSKLAQLPDQYWWWSNISKTITGMHSKWNSERQNTENFLFYWKSLFWKIMYIFLGVGPLICVIIQYIDIFDFYIYLSSFLLEFLFLGCVFKKQTILPVLSAKSGGHWPRHAGVVLSACFSCNVRN